MYGFHSLGGKWLMNCWSRWNNYPWRIKYAHPQPHQYVELGWIGVLGSAAKSFSTEADWGALHESSVKLHENRVYLCCLPLFPMFDSSENPPRSHDDGPNGRARHLVPGRMSKIGGVAEQIPQDKSMYPKVWQQHKKKLQQTLGSPSPFTHPWRMGKRRLVRCPGFCFP